MARIGEYRLKVYNLLYEKPICKYTVTEKQKKQSNVLILGTGWIGNEVFKASFWAGQNIDKGDTEKALYWYTEGSNLGNEKCMKKLFEN